LLSRLRFAQLPVQLAIGDDDVGEHPFVVVAGQAFADLTILCGSDAMASMLLASAAGSESVSQPVTPSSIASGIPPKRVPSSGRPAAFASATTSGPGSCQIEGAITTSTAL